MVPHERLLLKIEAHGTVGRVSGWIRDWLKGRQQRVVLYGSYSEWPDVVSGDATRVGVGRHSVYYLYK